MKKKLLAGGVLGMICVSVLVVKGVSQTPETIPLPQTPTPSRRPASSPVAVPKATPSGRVNVPQASYLLGGQPGQGQTLEQVSDRIRLASMYQQADEQPLQGQSLEEIAEALQAVRARQKELKSQESELLAKMAEKIEQKRKELQKSEEMLQQLQGITPAPRISPTFMRDVDAK